ncbi:MAG: sugar transferase [Planctomycetes bacterium]|nr:sugar transferase [Planctomycetota bacterium]
MQWIIVREPQDRSAEQGVDLLRYALSTPPLPRVVLDGLRHLASRGAGDHGAGRIGGTKPDESLWVLPGHWQANLGIVPGRAVFFDEALHLEVLPRQKRGRGSWHVIANGRFAAYIDPQLLGQFLETGGADVIAVTAAPDLLACGERVRLTSDNKVVGYRRLYADALSPAPLPADWPHLLFVRQEVSAGVLNSGLLSSFGVWIDECRAAGLRWQSLAVAGSAYDLGSVEGILAVSGAALSCSARWGQVQRVSPPGEGGGVSPEAHVIGPVLLGRQVTVAADVVLVGPAVLCDGSTVGRGALVDSSIVGSGVSVEPKQSLRACVVTASPAGRVVGRASAGAGRPRQEHPGGQRDGAFRVWPRLSYARCFKRIADIVAAVFILVLFAPVIPLIALAVKIGSPGPAFFADKRQGLHGRPFRCIKFRTMKQGADKIQDKLRFASEVDGPQFKMADDPRITTMGRFLRETYLDEIPQFLNVLRGQMSVVGPRPSPEAENTLCPSWRDARLSVRPGITGLWQVYCTRDPQKDFQEWIQYDMQYVRDFSVGLDLWICWRTFMKMVGTFVRQF